MKIVTSTTDKKKKHLELLVPYCGKLIKSYFTFLVHCKSILILCNILKISRYLINSNLN